MDLIVFIIKFAHSINWKSVGKSQALYYYIEEKYKMSLYVFVILYMGIVGLSVKMGDYAGKHSLA